MNTSTKGEHSNDAQPSAEGVYFHQIASSTKEIKANRAQLTTSCSGCTKMGKTDSDITLLKCSRCKIAWYCSKMCQKKDWPIHRQVCSTGSPIPKMVRSFVANPLLRFMIEIAFVVAFKINENSLASDKPLLARCDLSIYPVDKNYVKRLQLGKINDAKLAQGTQGMLQINSFIALDSSTEFDHTRMKLWRNSKEHNRVDSAARGVVGRPVALVDFYMPKNTFQTITVSTPISKEAVQYVKEGGGFQQESALDANFYRPDAKLSEQSCLDFINEHIQLDEGNQLRLRTHMTKEDIERFRTT